MTRDDIIRMAQEAGGRFHGPNIEHLSVSEEDFLSKLAPALLTAGAAAEREKVAHWMMQRGYATGHGDTTEDLLEELDWQVRESEREECAKMVENRIDPPQRNDFTALHRAAAAIRARGAP